MITPAPGDPTLRVRILGSIRVDENGCWVWQKSTNSDGYGRIKVLGKRIRAHRAAYLVWIGPVPKGRVLDHLCRVPACVNPQHLEPVTDYENTMRSPIAPAAVNAAKTECMHGHPFTPENTYVRVGKRSCRECNRLSNLRHRRSQKEARKEAA